jgi:hypothetical protein
MILIPLILIFPEQAEALLRTVAGIIEANLVWLHGLSQPAQVGVRLLLAAVGMGVFLIGLLFLVLEVIPRGPKTVKLADGSGDLVMDGVSGHLAYYIDALPDVLRVRPSVTRKGKSVRVSLYVETAPDVNVPTKSAEAREEARRVIEEQLGLEVNGEIQVVIRPIAYPRSERPAATKERAASPAEKAVPAAQPGPAEQQGGSQVVEAKEPSS